VIDSIGFGWDKLKKDFFEADADRFEKLQLKSCVCEDCADRGRMSDLISSWGIRNLASAESSISF
jgi:hypothetical protein